MSRSRRGGRRLALVLCVLVACSAAQEASDESRGACQENLAAATEAATERGIEVAEAYASTMPALAELALTGAIRSNAILFEGIQQKRPFSNVPRDLRRQLRPLEEKFKDVRRKSKLHLRTLDSLGDAAVACRELARATEDECLEVAATRVKRAADDLVSLAERRMEMSGTNLRRVASNMRNVSLDVERASQELSAGMNDVSNCLA